MDKNICVGVRVTHKKTGNFHLHTIIIGENTIINEGYTTLEEYIERALERDYKKSEIYTEINAIKGLSDNCKWAKHWPLKNLYEDISLIAQSNEDNLDDLHVHVPGMKRPIPNFEALKKEFRSPGISIYDEIKREKPEILCIPELKTQETVDVKFRKKTFEKIKDTKATKVHGKTSLWTYFWIVSAIMLVVSYLFDKVLI